MTELETLLARVQAGDEPALAELLRRYEPRLRLAARTLLGPRLRQEADSIDLVQSVHRALLPGLREGRYEVPSEDRLLALAVTVLKRKVIRASRRGRHRQLPTDSAALQEASARGAEHLDPGRQAETDDGLTQILESLPPDDRQLVELRLAGWSNVEIAAQLESDPHLLRARLSRLRKKLREAGRGDWV